MFSLLGKILFILSRKQNVAYLESISSLDYYHLGFSYRSTKNTPQTVKWEKTVVIKAVEFHLEDKQKKFSQN